MNNKAIGQYIQLLRKQSGMSQKNLAERLSVSYQAVSKWDRGESLPDLPTIVLLAELFEVTVDDLIVDPDALPETTGKVEKIMSAAVEKTLKRKADKRIIAQLCTVLVAFIALLCFVICNSLEIKSSWIAFVYAVPVACLVLLVLRSAWRDFRSNKWLITGLMWGFLTSLYLSLLLFLDRSVWTIFLLGVPGQIAIFLWFRMLHKIKTGD